MRTRTCAPAVRRADISGIAYGFMASQALFAALEIGLFSHLAAGPRTVDELIGVSGVAPNRLRTLLHALVGLGLIVADEHGYGNAPASDRYLVRGAPGDFGEYFRLQIAQQIYPALLHLGAGLQGTGSAFGTFTDLLSRPYEARIFTSAQHAGSLTAARALAERVPMEHARTLLDVGGGSGAFAITLCGRNPRLRATVLDFAAVTEVAREYRDAAGLASRIALLGGDAVHTPWPPDQDIVLMSYLLSAIGDGEIDVALAKAYACLRPGGLLVVHDFMLDDDEAGPALAALWFLQYIAYRSDGVSFSARSLAARLVDAGFAASDGEALIPEITKVILARKAAA
ncbi:MAG TPA: methyltransferase [Pseudonocardia sp.]|uniref:methyltransferase n=1 Tax=Pseudonocardia sp. TaxID=60912 RepID=UPI002BE7AC17|nr:methyltransferase [Pseudonocardia sp.]HTF51756.1 methyltransferase [Pseudonocardia sp.]